MRSLIGRTPAVLPSLRLPTLRSFDKLHLHLISSSCSTYCVWRVRIVKISFFLAPCQLCWQASSIYWPYLSSIHYPKSHDCTCTKCSNKTFDFDVVKPECPYRSQWPKSKKQWYQWVLKCLFVVLKYTCLYLLFYPKSGHHNQALTHKCCLKPPSFKLISCFLTQS